MKTLTKSVLALVTASVLSTAAFAGPRDSNTDNVVYDQISSSVQVTDNSAADLDANAAYVPSQNASHKQSGRADFLQNKIN